MRNFFKKILFVLHPVLLDIILDYAVKKAEEEITKSKTGKLKKDYVIKFIADFSDKTGISIEISRVKLENMITIKVNKLINKI